MELALFIYLFILIYPGVANQGPVLPWHPGARRLLSKESAPASQDWWSYENWHCSPCAQKKCCFDLRLLLPHVSATIYWVVKYILPRKAPGIRTTRSSTSGHPYVVSIPRSRTNLHLASYIPRTSRMWNLLPASVFSTTPDLDTFKSAVNVHLLDQS